MNTENVKLIKFADDSTIQGLITNSDDSYKEYVNTFTTWCDDHYLLLNVKKTKEMLIDFRIKKSPIQPLTIKNETVDIVDTYKYLGVTIDNIFDWHAHTSTVYKKINQRLFFLRKLRQFNIDNRILSLFIVLSFKVYCYFAYVVGVGTVGTMTILNLTK